MAQENNTPDAAPSAAVEHVIAAENWLRDSIGGVASETVRSPWAQSLIGLALVLLFTMLVYAVARRVGFGLMRAILERVQGGRWAKALDRHRIDRYATWVITVITLHVAIEWVPHFESVARGVQWLCRMALLVLVIQTLSRLLGAMQQVFSGTTQAQTRSIKGYIQLARIALFVIGAVVFIAIVIDRSPLLMLSGLGAMSAVLLLVFKDTLLSLMASVQLTSNDMLRIGDWIEMPQAGADGFVIDIALHTVKVENWDKTVTTIPTYKLFSESYRNWRTMFQSGGRRIKRTLRLDAACVRFLSDEECDEFRRFRLLRSYLDEKQNDLHRSNDALGERDPVNHRRLTNIGTFRAYAMAYLRQHEEINQDMILMVRMMEPQTNGIPIELYCFTSDTAWVQYERVQGDIFDHLLAILPEMGLRLYQAPSGNDLHQASLPGAWAASSLAERNLEGPQAR